MSTLMKPSAAGCTHPQTNYSSCIIYRAVQNDKQNMFCAFKMRERYRFPSLLDVVERYDNLLNCRNACRRSKFNDMQISIHGLGDLLTWRWFWLRMLYFILFRWFIC